jgi:glycosyltransferase involved in cell wall biosynthesis
MKTFSVVTPCINAEDRIESTILSVLNNTEIQEERAKLEYIVCDGSSSDRTVEIVKRLFEQAKKPNMSLTLITEPDKGMYDALAKGLKKTTGDVISYINAGDLYAPTAFRIVSEVMDKWNIKWLSGMIVVYNMFGDITYAATPFRYQKELIKKGFYKGRFLPFIQQESVFWDSKLLNNVNYNELTRLKYAGDFHLWKSFAQTTELMVVNAWLGGFLVHQGQLSEDMSKYLEEMRDVADTPRLRDYVHALTELLLWRAPFRLKTFLGSNRTLYYDHQLQEYILRRKGIVERLGGLFRSDREGSSNSNEG